MYQFIENKSKEFSRNFQVKKKIILTAQSTQERAVCEYIGPVFSAPGEWPAMMGAAVLMDVLTNS